MDTRTKSTLLWSAGAILFIAGIFTLFLSFGGSKEKVSELDLAYTNAALTISAREQTLQAAQLSATPNPALLISPTTTFTPLPTATFQASFPTSTIAVGPVTTCDNAAYLSDVTIPDGTVVTPGQAFTKTWKVSNTGTCTWTATYQIVFISGDVMSGKATSIGKIVKPGESIDVSVALTAPAQAGSITGRWRLSNDKSQPFGDSLTVVITVGATTGTASATPTRTPTPGGVIVVTATYTPTPTPTSTSAAPTSTPVPTETPTPTPTATP